MTTCGNATTRLGADGEPDAAKLDLIGRMGGETYVRARDRFEIKVPS